MPFLLPQTLRYAMCCGSLKGVRANQKVQRMLYGRYVLNIKKIFNMFPGVANAPRSL